MKRKFSDRANWRRIIKKRYSSLKLNTDEFQGMVTFYQIVKLKEPLLKTFGGVECRLADEGYVWLQHYPKDANYIVTTIFDRQLRVVQWYIDICKSQGLTDQNVPWFDDLYLDIVILPSGKVLLLDEDELADALRAGTITDQDSEFAHREASLLLNRIQAGTFPYQQLSNKHLYGLFGDMLEDRSRKRDSRWS